MRRLLLMVLLSMLLLPVAAWSMNTDFEGGFQANGVGIDWSPLVIGDPAPICAQENTIVHGGTKAQKVDATGGPWCEGGVYIMLDTVPGRSYTVSVWVNCTAAGQAYFAVNADGVAGPAQDWTWNNSADTWEQLTKTVTATGSQIAVLCDCWAYVSYFDDLTVTVAEDLFGPAPYCIYTEPVYWQKWDLDHGGVVSSGDPLGHGQVLIDGDKSVIAEGDAGVLVYRDEQVNGTAFVQSTPRKSYIYPNNYGTKGGTLLNGYVYSQDMFSRIHKCTAWEGLWDEPGFDTGRVQSDTYGLVTDGTYLYGSDNLGPFEQRDNASSKIYKWSVDPVTHDVNPVPVWVKEIPAPHSWVVAVGYYNGKLYAAEGFRGRNIYEIDCSDGAFRTILNADNLMPSELGQDAECQGQVARCGNILAYASATGHLITWKLIDGVWTKYSCSNPYKPTGANYFLGISLKPGPDGNGKYAWTSAANIVQFWDMFPDFTPRSLGDARKSKNGYLASVKDAAVTKVGTGEFWVEDKDRASGCRVAWAGTMPAVNTLVSMTGTIGTADSGEKVYNAATVDSGDAFTVKPLYLTNKSMGPATGGAGLATDGMLVKVTGRVTGQYVPDVENPPVYLIIDDGSGVNSGIAGINGIRVSTADMMAVDRFMDIVLSGSPYPFKAEVTGIVRLEKLTDGTIIRRIEALSDADVVITDL